jgi:hypothetical protein
VKGTSRFFISGRVYVEEPPENTALFFIIYSAAEGFNNFCRSITRHKDKNGSLNACLAKPLHNLKSVDSRQYQVKQSKIKAAGLAALQSLSAITS